ncbi:MAG: type II secretion system F family protein, partial [Armatimonadota bacterium]|nr:type II secretion system F family protein [Armatimonadota bacterium]
ALSSLYRAGVPFAQSVETAAPAAGNRFVTETLLRTVPAIQRGERLSSVVAPARVLTPMALNMLRTGEETGNLDEMLDKVADYCEAEAENTLKRFTTVLGPALILFVGIVVGAEVVRFYANQVRLYEPFMNE